MWLIVRAVEKHQPGMCSGNWMKICCRDHKISWVQLEILADKYHYKQRSEGPWKHEDSSSEEHQWGKWTVNFMEIQQVVVWISLDRCIKLSTWWLVLEVKVRGHHDQYNSSHREDEYGSGDTERSGKNSLYSSTPTSEVNWREKEFHSSKSNEF